MDSHNGKTPFGRFTLLEPWRMTAQQLWHCYVVQNYRTSSDVVVGVVTGVFVATGFARPCQKLQTLYYFLKENYPSFPKHRKQVDIDKLRLGIVGMLLFLFLQDDNHQKQKFSGRTTTLSNLMEGYMGSKVFVHW